MRSLSYIILPGVALLLGLSIWGALLPSQENWGVHFLAFYSSEVVLLVAALFVVLPALVFKSALLRVAERLAGKFSRVPPPVLYVLILALLLAIGAVASPTLHLLGDGALLLRSLSNATWESNIIQSFNNQPLMFMMFRYALNAQWLASTEATHAFYVWIDRVGAAVFLGLVFWLVRSFKIPPLDKFLLGTLLFCGGGSQFFFGYIENYTLAYVAAAGYAITGWMALEDKASLVYPLVFFHILVGTSLGSLIFLPSLFILGYFYFRGHLGRALLLAGGIAGLDLGVFLSLGYDLKGFTRHFTGDAPDFLRPFSGPDGIFPYAMFSPLHLLDWLNANLLMAPLALLVAGAGLWAMRKERWRETPALIFLVAAAFFGLLFTWVVNASLGMARDWDVLTNFFAPLIVLAVYVLLRLHGTPKWRETVAVLVTVCAVHVALWIGVNADADRHLRRVKLLGDNRFLSFTSQLFFDEALANFYFDRQHYAEARTYYEHFISIDDDNPRIVGNISDVYRKLGEKEKYFAMLQRAVDINSTDPGVYSNLGVEYAGRGDTNKAIFYNEKSIALDPRQEKAHANLGILYASKKAFPQAQQHLLAALDLGMRDPILLRYAADISQLLGDYARAISLYDAFLTNNPGDESMRAKRQRAVIGLQDIQRKGTPTTR